MKVNIRNIILTIAVFFFFFCTDENEITIYPYQDVGGKDLSDAGYLLDSSLILKLDFDDRTIFPLDFQGFADTILEKAKNHGMGIREIHQNGITGKGVTCAIIDLPNRYDHEEYAGKILKYKDLGCNNEGQKEFHGSSVISLLVGNSIGTAPDAKIYFAAVPSWKADAKYYADALMWIIEENRLLSAWNKIRIVSASVNIYGTEFSYKNQHMWDSILAIAENENFFVLTVSMDKSFYALPGYYDISDPDNLDKFTIGLPVTYPASFYKNDTSRIYVPVRRTTVLNTISGLDAYMYASFGWYSWPQPYLAGVMASAWQIRPNLSNDEIVDLLLKSAYRKGDYRIVNPQAFIDSVSKY